MTTPPRSRLLASLATTAALLYLAAFSPTAALETDAHRVPNVLLDDLLPGGGNDGRGRGLGVSYESEFTVVGGGSLQGRAADDINVLGDNEPERFTMEKGSIAYFALSLDGLTSRDESAIPRDGEEKRNAAQEEEEDMFRPEGNASGGGLLYRKEESRAVYVSANICRYPTRVGGKPSNSDPPQLWMVISADSSDQHPKSTKPSAQADLFHEGAAMRRISASSSVVYFSIEAPDLSDDFEGGWSFEVAVSTSDWYHSIDEDESPDMLSTVGMDNASVLLATKSLTDDIDEAQAIMESPPPYTLFVYSADSPHIKGVRHSYCGLENYAQIASMKDKKPSDQVTMSMTTRGHSRLPRQQFWLSGLNATTAYTAILVRTGQDSLTKRQNDESGSGSGAVRVFRETQFQTTTGENCKIVTDLEFCTDVEYPVPANNDKFNNTALAKKYDDYAKEMYANFEKAIQQIPCEAPVTSQYSLARSCDDCKTAYKNWLCAVAIPRCEDFSSDNPHALIRNAEQEFPNGTSLDESLIKELKGRGPGLMSSRNAWIDEEIAPGPYKEVLPCDDVCYDLVQSCPADIGFGCPLPGGDDGMFAMSYARRVDERSCNAPGSAGFDSGAATLAARGPFFVGLMMTWMSLL